LPCWTLARRHYIAGGVLIEKFLARQNRGFRDGLLGVIYSGDWNRCWLEESPSTDQSVTNAAPDPTIQTYNYVLIIANESGYGGCRRGSRLYITSGVTWDVVAHEYGHGVANLFDEYYSAGAGYTGVPLNIRNCSTVLPSNGLRDVVWKAFIAPGTPLATDGAPGINLTRTVGMFAGCNYSDTRIYRPAHDCPMNTTASEFCPVCLANLRTSVKPYLSRSPPWA
jgi:IgA Peptidase M64